MFKKIVVAVFLLLWIVSAIKPVNDVIWFVENLIVFLSFPLVIWFDKKYSFSNTAFFFLFVFVSFHLVGSHFTYAKINQFDLFKNFMDYDKIVHFMYGLLAFVPFFEISLHSGNTKKMSYFLAFLLIVSIATAYELLEWIVVILVHPEAGGSYIITQGDEWDAQKDIAYAIIGALIALFVHKMAAKKVS